MLLGSGNNQVKQQYSSSFDSQYKEDIEFGACLISRGQSEEAWIFLNTLKIESIPLLYNKALCLYESSQNEAIISLLERAWALFGPLDTGIMPLASPELTSIREVQKNKLSYLNPVTFRYTDIFPYLLKDSILCFMVDIYLKLGNKTKVIEIAAPLKSKSYRNINEALKELNKTE